jgi:uncharacterized membrane protein YkoI
MSNTEGTKLPSNRLLMYGAIVVAAVSLLTATISSGVLAQGVNSTPGNATTTNPNQANSNLPNITGSIPLRSTISGALSSKVKTTLSDAIGIAQKAVGSNTLATLGILRPLNGFLVYDIHVKNNADNTTHAVIVDPGNGKVLYNQPLTSLFGGGGVGHFGMFGGQGKMGPWFGGHGYGGGSQGGFWYHGGGGSGITMGQSTHMVPMDSISASRV